MQPMECCRVAFPVTAVGGSDAQTGPTCAERARIEATSTNGYSLTRRPRRSPVDDANFRIGGTKEEETLLVC